MGWLEYTCEQFQFQSFLYCSSPNHIASRIHLLDRWGSRQTLNICFFFLEVVNSPRQGGSVPTWVWSNYQFYLFFMPRFILKFLNTILRIRSDLNNKVHLKHLAFARMKIGCRENLQNHSWSCATLVFIFNICILYYIYFVLYTLYVWYLISYLIHFFIIYDLYLMFYIHNNLKIIVEIAPLWVFCLQLSTAWVRQAWIKILALPRQLYRWPCHWLVRFPNWLDSQLGLQYP